MPHGPAEAPERPSKQLHGWRFFTWALLGTVGVILSCVLFLFYYPSEKSHWIWRIDAIYRGVQLLLLHFPIHEVSKIDGVSKKVEWPPNRMATGLLVAAQVCAVIFVALSAVLVVVEVFGKSLRDWWIAFRGEHSIICSASRTGEVLVDEFGKCHRVRQIEKIDTVTTKTLDDALLQAGLRKAEHLVLATDDDGDNIAVALRAREIEGAQPLVYLHVARPDLRALLRHQRVLQREHGKSHVRLFDIYEHSARLLLRDQPLDYEPIAENDGRIAQLIVIGFGRMGEAVLTRAAMIGHYANLKPLRVKVVDRQAPLKERQFYSRYRLFREICNAEFIDLNAEDPPTWSRVAEWCANEKETISTAVIALDQNVLGLSLALSLRERLRPEVPIRVRLPEQSTLVEVMGEDRRIDAFGSIRQACAYENVVGEQLDTMAKAVHQYYLEHQHASCSARRHDPSMRKWDELDDEIMDSNRQQADHISAKLRAVDPDYDIDFYGDKDGEPITLNELVHQLTKPRIELLAKMEHHRWMAERRLAGWRKGPKDFDAPSSPYLIPWEELDHDIQEIDRNFVRHLPKIVEKAGLKIRRKPKRRAAT